MDGIIDAREEKRGDEIVLNFFESIAITLVGRGSDHRAILKAISNEGAKASRQAWAETKSKEVGNMIPGILEA